MPISVRLDDETEALLNKTAKALDTTKSKILKASVRDFCKKTLGEKRKKPYNLISDLNKNGMFCCQNRKTHQLKMEIKKLNKEIDTNKILIDNLKKDIEYFKSQCSSKNICAICNDSPREYANIQCGHLCACATCASKLENICPICKQFGSFKKIYVP